MQLRNGAQFLNTTFLLALFPSVSAAAVLLTVIDPLTRIYMHHYNYINYTLAM